MNKTKTNNNSTTTTTSYSVPKDTLPLDVQQTCTDFSTALSSIEHLVRPLVSSTDKAGHLLHHSKELAPIEKAKLNLCYAYTVNTLLYSTCVVLSVLIVFFLFFLIFHSHCQ